MHPVPQHTLDAALAYLLEDIGLDLAALADSAAARAARAVGADRAACRAWLLEEAIPGGAVYRALTEQVTVSPDALTVRLRGLQGVFRIAVCDWKHGGFEGCTRLNP